MEASASIHATGTGEEARERNGRIKTAGILVSHLSFRQAPVVGVNLCLPNVPRKPDLPRLTPQDVLTLRRKSKDGLP